MKRVFHHYKDWEEVRFGMYKKQRNTEYYVNKAYHLLRTPDVLYHFMKRTTEEWPKSTAHNLTNPNRNKQAWLGQASCCLYAGVPEELTKIAWSKLTDEQKEKANLTADKVYAEWVKDYAKNI